MNLEDQGRAAPSPAAQGSAPKRGLALYDALFAARVRAMRSSAMRDMFALTERPEVISLAGGLPDTSTFPPSLYASLMEEVAQTSAARALQYGPTEGLRAAAQCAALVMAEEGVRVDPDQLLITTGGQQVLDLVTKVLIDPGDVILAEGPTYPGAIPAFAAYQCDLHQVELDGEGLMVEQLAQEVTALRKAGRRVKLIYTVPNFQNPAGVTLSLERRHKLLTLAQEEELLILEDNPYGLLRYEGKPLPTLLELDQASGGGVVIYLGTFSKILAPGVRIGWVSAPPPILEKLNLAKQGADLCSSPLCQLFLAAYFKAQEGGRPFWVDYLSQLRALYRQRRDVMLAALAESLGGLANWRKPEGGLFIWVTLEERFDTTDLLARSQRVAFVPGRSAYYDGTRGANSMRLNFAGSTEPELREGVRRIGETIRREHGLLGALRASGRPAKGSRASRAPAGRRADRSQ